MKLLINAQPLLGSLTGVGNYTLHIIKGLLAELPPGEVDITYYYGFFSKKLILKQDIPSSPQNGKSAPVFSLKQTIKKVPGTVLLAKKIKDIISSFSAPDFDLYFEPNFTPLDFHSRNTVTTVHDFSFYLYPQWHPRERIDWFRKNFFQNIQKSDLIITPSKFIEEQARDILKRQDVISIPLGYDQEVFYPDATIKPKNFILFVGALEPRKNISGLLTAFELLPEYIKNEFRLVLSGSAGWENQSLMKQLDNMSKTVTYLRYVTTEKLASLYRQAYCLVYPSFYEGFGLPPLEAMACGCPVIVSDRASLPEVCGKSAIYIDPDNPESIADALTKLIESPIVREKMRNRGLERAASFSWQKTTKKHLQIFQDIIVQA